MADISGLIRKHLGELGLGPRREEEIFRELSNHLQDHAADLEARGAATDEAAREVLGSTSNWSELREQILAVENEEGNMNYRTKVLWLPALCALTLSNGLMAIIQVFGPMTHSSLLNPYLRMRPFYTYLFPWLILQLAVGAVAAYWSRRAGGALGHQVIAALAPAIAWLGVFVLGVPFAIILSEHGVHHIQLSAYLLMTVIWVLLPALTLLLGAAPFLRKPQTHS